MDVLDLTLPTPEENLALDEALLLEAETGTAGEVLRFWELPQYTVVLGAGCCLGDDVKTDACEATGVPILRRCSGGGTVLIGPGCLCFSLVLSMERPPIRDVKRSYAHILEVIRNALSPQATLSGSSDLAIAGRKFSGNSQRRLRRYILHHGTILYDFDVPRIERYLNVPRRQPDYRRQRGHNEFVENLHRHRQAIIADLASAWGAARSRIDWPSSLVESLAQEKYQRDEWTRRR